MCLFGCLDDTQTVTATIRHDGGREPDEGVASELLERFFRVGFRDVFLQGVEHKEPWEAILIVINRWLVSYGGGGEGGREGRR